MPSVYMYINLWIHAGSLESTREAVTRIALQTSQVYIELNMSTAKAMNQFSYNTAIITTKTGFI